MKAHATLNFTIDNLNNLPIPDHKIFCYKDKHNTSLNLYVTPAGAKTFFVRKRVRGRDKRIRIGSYPTVSIAQARKQATVYAADVELGLDPMLEKRKAAQRGITVGEQCAIYTERHAKQRNKGWKTQEREMAYYLKPLWRKPIADVTREDVERLHTEIGKRAPYQANRAVSNLRAVYNHAIKRGWEGRNPATSFDRFKERNRDRFIQPEEMPFLLRAIETDASETLRDLFMVLLLTGARRGNVLAMRFEQIDWHFCQWRIPETKNGQPLVLPLVEKAMEILCRRRVQVNSPWVFPQDADNEKPFNNPQKGWERIRARATLNYWSVDERLAAFIEKVRTSVPTFYNYAEDMLVRQVMKRAKERQMRLPMDMTDLRIHDLRRTFGSYQALMGASLPIIGRSLGHKSIMTTQIYARLHLDPVRTSAEKATQAMFSL